jgi:PEP-CTERM motif
MEAVMNKIKMSMLLVVFGLVAAQSASAYTINLGGTPLAGQGLVSSVAGAVTTDFNGGLPGNYSGGLVVSGSLGGQYASPPNDTSKYFTVGGTNPNAPSPGVVSFGFLAKYFGFYGGSPDAYNGLQLFNGESLVKSFTGADIATFAGVPPNGNQSVGYYFNIFADNSTEYFDKVSFLSSQAAYETDNHAVLAAAVPEPETYAMMMAGLSVMGFVARRRKSVK